MQPRGSCAATAEWQSAHVQKTAGLNGPLLGHRVEQKCGAEISPGHPRKEMTRDRCDRYYVCGCLRRSASGMNDGATLRPRARTPRKRRGRARAPVRLRLQSSSQFSQSVAMPYMETAARPVWRALLQVQSSCPEVCALKARTTDRLDANSKTAMVALMCGDRRQLIVIAAAIASLRPATENPTFKALCDRSPESVLRAMRQ